jgi:hypothetical protein
MLVKREPASPPDNRASKMAATSETAKKPKPAVRMARIVSARPFPILIQSANCFSDLSILKVTLMASEA